MLYLLEIKLEFSLDQKLYLRLTLEGETFKTSVLANATFPISIAQILPAAIKNNLLRLLYKLVFECSFSA